MTLLASAALGVFPRQSSKVLSASDHHLQASEGTPPEARAAVRGDAWIQTMHAVAHDVKLKTKRNITPRMCELGSTSGNCNV